MRGIHSYIQGRQVIVQEITATHPDLTGGATVAVWWDQDGDWEQAPGQPERPIIVTLQADEGSTISGIPVPTDLNLVLAFTPDEALRTANALRLYAQAAKDQGPRPETASHSATANTEAGAPTPEPTTGKGGGTVVRCGPTSSLRSHQAAAKARAGYTDPAQAEEDRIEALRAEAEAHVRTLIR